MTQKRDQIIKTGEALFVKHGMRRVTVEEICRQAGVSKPTFYKYFQNKAALARRIDELWIEEALQRIDRIEEAEVPFPEKLKQILAIKQELAARPGPEFLEDLIQLDIDLSYAFGRVKRFLVKGQQEGDIRADVRPEFLMAAFEVLNSMQHDPRIRGLYVDAETLARDVFMLFHYGALSTDHREAGLAETGAGPKGGDVS
ncbi:MAG TPA: helix-turn-helix domain-containing protein [Anaerolineae bacterium]|nr:helix-turn-helix domain-containing protein [Anaerolineae bacterium]